MEPSLLIPMAGLTRKPLNYEFGERCPDVMVNNEHDVADYIVVLDHEGGKGLLRHKNKVAVFEQASGDSIVSHSTLSLGSCIYRKPVKPLPSTGRKHGTEIRAAAKAKAAPSAMAAPDVVKSPASSAPKLSLASTPDGADIEIDGSFVGNTPSAVEVAPGEHQVVIKKAGYKPWERKLKATGGDIKLDAELEKQSVKESSLPPEAKNPGTLGDVARRYREQKAQ